MGPCLNREEFLTVHEEHALSVLPQVVHRTGTSRVLSHSDTAPSVRVFCWELGTRGREAALPQHVEWPAQGLEYCGHQINVH